MDNIINEAIQKLAKDSMLQKVSSVAITYSTTDGEVKTFHHTPIGENVYVMLGMVEELKCMVREYHFAKEKEE